VNDLLHFKNVNWAAEEREQKPEPGQGQAFSPLKDIENIKKNP